MIICLHSDSKNYQINQFLNTNFDGRQLFYNGSLELDRDLDLPWIESFITQPQQKNQQIAQSS